jgi:hypothetical protein
VRRRWLRNTVVCALFAVACTGAQPVRDAASLGRIAAELETAHTTEAEAEILRREGFRNENEFRSAVEVAMDDPERAAEFARTYESSR